MIRFRIFQILILVTLLILTSLLMRWQEEKSNHIQNLTGPSGKSVKNANSYALAIAPSSSPNDTLSESLVASKLNVLVGTLEQKLALIGSDTPISDAERRLGARIVILDDQICVYAHGEEHNQTANGSDSHRGNPICYPKIFQPGPEYRPILYQQQISKGLDVRMNLQSGLREARLLPAPSSPYVEQQRPSKGYGMTPYLSNAIDTLEAAYRERTSTSKILKQLEALEDLVHDIDDGAEFMLNRRSTKTGRSSLDLVIQIIVDQSLDPQRHSEVRRWCAIVLGSAMENNEVAQLAAMSYRLPVSSAKPLYDFLLDAAIEEKDPITRTEFLFAFYSLTRGNQIAIEMLFEPHSSQYEWVLQSVADGVEAKRPLLVISYSALSNDLRLKILFQLLQDRHGTTQRGRRKLINFIEDVVTYLKEKSREDLVKDGTSLLVWCDQLQNYRSEDYLVESALQAIETFLEWSATSGRVRLCSIKDEFKSWYTSDYLTQGMSGEFPHITAVANTNGAGNVF